MDRSFLKLFCLTQPEAKIIVLCMTDLRTNNNDLKKCFSDDNVQVHSKMSFFSSSILEN